MARLADGSTQTLSCRDEERIASIVTERVVDDLEMVEIDQEQGEPGPLTIGQFDEIAHVSCELSTIGKGGKSVEIGQIFELVMSFA